jgi:sec-independent protein translocase protein TatA
MGAQLLRERKRKMNDPQYLLAFSLGPMEIALLLFVMIFAFGPKRIPEIGKSVGEALAGFRKATKDEPAHKDDEH